MRTFILSVLSVCLVADLTPGAEGFSQSSTLPRTVEEIEGKDTVRGYKLNSDGTVVLDPSGQVLTHLPAPKRKSVRELMGMLHDGTDFEWFVRRCDYDSSEFSLEIFRGKRGAEARFVHEFRMDGAFHWVRFFQPPDARDKPAVFVDVNPGSLTLWSHLLSPDRQSMEWLFEKGGAERGEFVDLDGDGVFELIGWGDGGSPRCTFFLSPRPGPGKVAQVFIHVGPGYRLVFPRRDSALSIVDATLSDLRGDGAIEMITIEEGPTKKPSQRLAVYKFENKSFRLVAQRSLPLEPVAFLVDTHDTLDGKEILVRSANNAECKTYPPPEEAGTVKAYVLRGDRLEAVGR